MKVKRFKNLWAMGLILFGAILLLFYVAKIFFPEFIVGVAEIPSVVAFGNYVDSHLWATLLFTFAVSFVGGYIYGCACCKQNKLSKIQVLILAATVILLMICQWLTPQMYVAMNYTAFIVMPFLMIVADKRLGKETFISTVSCYSIDIVSQALSIAIRDIVVMSTCINSATMTILLIDTWIWRILLYLFFNHKKEKGEE